MKTLFTKAWLSLPRVVAGRIVDAAEWQLSPRVDVGLLWAKSHYEFWCWLLWFDWLWRCGEVETEEPEFPSAGMDLRPFSSSVDLIGRWGLDGSAGTFPVWLSLTAAPAPEPQPPAVQTPDAVTWKALAERFQEMAYSEKPEEIPNTLDWVEVKTEETQAGDANGWQVEGHPSVADGSDIPKELFQNAARLAGRKLLSVNNLADDLRSEQDDLRRWFRLLVTEPDIVKLRTVEESEETDDTSRRMISMVGIVDASRLWCERFRTQGELEAEQPEQPTFWHSEMFTAVVWGTKRFEFKETQAACVCVMWKALDAGEAFQSQAYILENAYETYKEETGRDSEESQALEHRNRLRDVFKVKQKPHEAWGTMIVREGKDRYVLKRPDIGTQDSRIIPT